MTSPSESDTTETPAEADASSGTEIGLGIRRHFTEPGVDPYDTVEWERRDARIPDHRNGGDAFAQPGVEFPIGWSQSATNVVAQKYFRGNLGAPDREWSLRQVIDRIVDTIAEWGTDDGYFVDLAESTAFRDELTYLLLHQRAAFNSPVYFNIGVDGRRQQSSACQPWGALVSTPEGMIPIGRLVDENAVGAKVYDGSDLTAIVAVKANGTKEVLRIHTKAGLTLDVTGDHLVYSPRSRKFVAAETLRAGDALEWHRVVAGGAGAFTAADVAEAALAGWLQADGFVGQYQGTNRSLTIEAMSVNPDEYRWVTEHIEHVFSGAHSNETRVRSQDEKLDIRRTRLYGNHLRRFVDDWDLLKRRHDMRVPQRLFEDPIPVAQAYLRSLFQAEGYVSNRGNSAVVGLAMISEELVRGLQQLLMRFGIFSRVRRKAEPRENRCDTFEVVIQNVGDQIRFSNEIGFIGAEKQHKLEACLNRTGRGFNDVKTLEIDRVEVLGESPVYDIQTQSGEYLSNNLRVHNCFILNVDDTMDSILNWYREEGIIFKGGSGAGVNLSNLRSSLEQLSGGGTASGPVSFMRGADASAGTIKSGGTTRRAAKMVVLDADHPDIEEFIWCKAVEERKARALREAGFDMDIDGKDSFSIQYQNANNSVRLSDDFMQAAVENQDWELTSRSTGETLRRIKAADLMHQISRAAWECADPGVQYDTTINRWHVIPNAGRINASNPCSEFLSVDDSACNLASINLLRYLHDDGSFDVAGFVHTVAVLFTAQEILVGHSDYPTEKIGENARKHREIGLGYTNLGALIMALGLPYDSASGRAWASAITALMTGTAYSTSALIAGRMGPFEDFDANADAALEVLRMHRRAAAKIDEEQVSPELLSAAQHSWDNAVELADAFGIRNSQATVLAPTGTISFMMDADTTGIEPEFALVKNKKLVGGGEMRIANQTVPRALRRLGYGERQIDQIIEHIEEKGSIIGAPGVDPSHYPVFACAIGEGAIAPMGHVAMMAAAQPWISGSISKTVNVPQDTTVDEIEQIYLDGWRLGLKALAIYRDNCKVSQPLNALSPTIATSQLAETVEKIVETIIVQQPVRQKLPRQRVSKTFSFRVADCHGYVTVGEFEDGRPGEIFLRVAKQGSTLAGMMDAFAISVSHGLQYGVPLKAFIDMFTNMRFEPAGMTDDPELRFATSLIDYIFRRLAVEYLPFPEREALGILTVNERTQPTLPGVEEAVTVNEIATEVRHPDDMAPRDAGLLRVPVLDTGSRAVGSTSRETEICGVCGDLMQRAGSCWTCPSCGSTSGCS